MFIKTNNVNIIDQQNQTAAYKIFHYYFKCLIPSHFLYSNEWFKVFTLPNNENKNSNLNEMVMAQLTIAQMAEQFSEGASISLIERSDGQKIYEIIMQHLIDWKNHSEEIGHLNPNLDDLKKLENLAKELFPIAKAQFHYKTNKENLFELFFNSPMTRFEKTLNNKKINEQPQSGEIKKNQSLMELIIENNKRNNNG